MSSRDRRKVSPLPVILAVALFAIVSAFLAPASAAMLDNGNFNDPARCASCHKTIFEQWDGSVHAMAAEDRVFRKFYEMVVDEAGPSAVDFCMKCHSPVGVLRHQVPPASGEKLDPIAMKGVFCDFCHTVKATGIGNSAFDTVFSTTKKGPLSDAKSPVHGTETNDLIGKSEFCGMCHNVTHPISGRPIERTYYEWKESPYNTGDPKTTTHCQDCHMRQAPGVPGTGSAVKVDMPGKAATGGPDREHVFTHYFIGGNTLYDNVANAARRRKMAEERLKAAVALEIYAEDLPRAVGDLATFRVRIHNTGAGHKLPTGLSEVREMWLDVAVTDASGKELMRSGTIGPTGDIDPSSAIFKTFLGVGGKNVKLSCCFFTFGEKNKLLSAERITRDRRIMPKGYEEEKYATPVPSDAKYPLTVTARLLYRSMSQGFANIFFFEEPMTVPVVEMAVKTMTMEAPKPRK